MVNTIYDQGTQYNSKQFKVLANPRMMYCYYWNHHSHIPVSYTHLTLPTIA